jgi:hypothetical protein
MKRDSRVMQRVNGRLCAPGMEGGRTDPREILSFFNSFISPASRFHSHHVPSSELKVRTYESIPA